MDYYKQLMTLQLMVIQWLKVLCLLSQDISFRLLLKLGPDIVVVAVRSLETEVVDLNYKAPCCVFIESEKYENMVVELWLIFVRVANNLQIQNTKFIKL